MMMIQESPILIADDDPHIRAVLRDALNEVSPSIVESGNAAETWKRVVEDKPRIILLDLRFPDCRDLSLLRRIREERPDTEVIVISGTKSIPEVVEAIRLGAYDFLAKPFVRDEVRNRVVRIQKFLDTQRSQQYLLKEIQRNHGGEFIGASPAMVSLRDQIARLAEVDSCVLIQGESGTGKELVARAIHLQSRRNARPFLAINAAALPESLANAMLFGHVRGSFTGANQSSRGFFEAAEDGTLFLDEIAEMPLPQQASLLRILEYRRYYAVGDTKERESRARYTFATNRDLKACVKNGTFREDLFYRIQIATVKIPPLRERPEDIEVLATHFVSLICKSMGRRPPELDASAIAQLNAYQWPGNVRELKNAIESTLIQLRGDTITADHLPAHVRPGGGLAISEDLSPLERQEIMEIVRAMRAFNGHLSKTAEHLGLHRNTLRNKIKKHSINKLL